ncbi:hypothetical protein HK405_005286 [Cladochytrium tenue]|nr:hypothetical protein HK405_005286 [Cladochytrium tenue]
MLGGDLGTDTPVGLIAAPTTPDSKSSPRQQPEKARHTDRVPTAAKQSPSAQGSLSPPVQLAASLSRRCSSLQPSTVDIEGILDDYLSLPAVTLSPSTSPPALLGKRATTAAAAAAADPDCTPPDGLAWVHEYYLAAWAATAEEAAAATAVATSAGLPLPASLSSSPAKSQPTPSVTTLSHIRNPPPHADAFPPAAATTASLAVVSSNNAHAYDTEQRPTEKLLSALEPAPAGASQHYSSPKLLAAASVELLFSAASPQPSVMPEPAASRASAAAGGWRTQQQAWGGSRELATAALSSPATSVTAPAAAGVERGGARALFLGRKLRAASAVRWAAVAASAAGGSRPSAGMSKANSCSSVFVEFSMTSADLQQVLKWCVVSGLER